jgi:hypothetical protein
MIIGIVSSDYSKIIGIVSSINGFMSSILSKLLDINISENIPTSILSLSYEIYNIDEDNIIHYFPPNYCDSDLFDCDIIILFTSNNNIQDRMYFNKIMKYVSNNSMITDGKVHQFAQLLYNNKWIYVYDELENYTNDFDTETIIEKYELNEEKLTGNFSFHYILYQIKKGITFDDKSMYNTIFNSNYYSNLLININNSLEKLTLLNIQELYEELLNIIDVSNESYILYIVKYLKIKNEYKNKLIVNESLINSVYQVKLTLIMIYNNIYNNTYNNIYNNNIIIDRFYYKYEYLLNDIKLKNGEYLYFSDYAPDSNKYNKMMNMSCVFDDFIDNVIIERKKLYGNESNIDYKNFILFEMITSYVNNSMQSYGTNSNPSLFRPL